MNHRITCVNLAARLAVIGGAWWMTVVVAACGGTSTPAPNPTSASPSGTALMKITDSYSPTIDPAAFSTTIDNPYFPMTPGTRIIYQANTTDGPQRTTTEVTRDTKTIM